MRSADRNPQLITATVRLSGDVMAGAFASRHVVQSSDHHSSHCISLVLQSCSATFGFTGLIALDATQPSPLCDVAI